MPDAEGYAGRIRVVWLHRDHVDADPGVLLTLLDAAERDRAAGFRRTDDRHRFVLGAALLHLELARATEGDPFAPAVDRTCASCGRPHGAPRPLAAGWSASVTHSGGVVAVALRPGPNVGIDVEETADPDHHTMASVLTERELDWVRAAAPGDGRFTRLWTGKEAVVKALGTGLADLAEVELDPATDVVRRLPAHAPGPVDLTYRTLTPRAGSRPGDPDLVAVASLGAIRGVDVVERHRLALPTPPHDRHRSHRSRSAQP